MTNPISLLLRLPLVALRRFAERIGEGGAFIVMMVTLGGPSAAMSPGNSPRLNQILVLVLMTSAACIFARSADSRGHGAIRRMLAKTGETPAEDAKLCKWLGVPTSASIETIKAAARARMKVGHSDKGGSGDMHDVVRVRDYLVQQAGRRPSQPSPAAQLGAWRQGAGRMGQFWGAMLPSKRLLALRQATGESLWPRFTQG